MIAPSRRIAHRGHGDHQLSRAKVEHCRPIAESVAAAIGASVRDHVGTPSLSMRSTSSFPAAAGSRYATARSWTMFQRPKPRDAPVVGLREADSASSAG